jgi:hypothetical protein
MVPTGREIVINGHRWVAESGTYAGPLPTLREVIACGGDPAEVRKKRDEVTTFAISGDSISNHPKKRKPQSAAECAFRRKSNHWWK